MVSRLNEITLFRNFIACFWFLWLGLLSMTNLVDCLQVFGLVKHELPFSSNNYELLVDFTATYGLSDLANKILLIAFTTILLGLLIYLARAVGQLLWQDKVGKLHKGFSYGLMLSAGSILLDQAFINYDSEQSHLTLFIAQLISYFISLKLTEMKQDLLSGGRIHGF